MNEAETLLQSAINLLAVLLPYIVPLIVAGASVWYKRHKANIERYLPENFRTSLGSAVGLAIYFAEQIGADQLLREYGKTKKEAAMDAAYNYLREAGYKNIDLSVLDAAIEAMLFAERRGE